MRIVRDGGRAARRDRGGHAARRSAPSATARSSASATSSRARHVEVQIFADTPGQRGRRSASGSAPSSAGTRRSSRRRRPRRSTPALRARAVRRGDRGRAGRRLRGRRHGRVPARPGRRVLLPGDEHPAAGRAPGHRVRDRARPGPAAAHRGRGRPLPFTATPPPLRGHAIEVRLYAEDPAYAWRPSTGTLHRFEVPEVAREFGPLSAPGLRLDSGVEDGSVVGVHYDPMLAKLIAWAPTRLEAARMLASALARTQVHGVVTNRDLLVRVAARTPRSSPATWTPRSWTGTPRSSRRCSARWTRCACPAWPPPWPGGGRRAQAPPSGARCPPAGATCPSAPQTHRLRRPAGTWRCVTALDRSGDAGRLVGATGRPGGRRRARPGAPAADADESRRGRHLDVGHRVVLGASGLRLAFSVHTRRRRVLCGLCGGLGHAGRGAPVPAAPPEAIEGSLRRADARHGRPGRRRAPANGSPPATCCSRSRR